MGTLHPVLAEQIKPKVQEVKEKQLWEKLMELAQKLGTKKPAGSDDFDRDSYELQLTIDQKTLRIYQSSYAIGGDYIIVEYDGRRVFEADEIVTKLRDDEFQEQAFLIIDPSGSEGRDGNDKYIRVKFYHSGPWVSNLNFKDIESWLEIQRRRATQVAAEERARAERNRPYTEAEKNLAAAFNLSNQPLTGKSNL